MAFVAALAGFDRLSPHGAATSLPAYLLGLSLTDRNGHHDRVAFCGFTTYLMLWSLLLFKHGCFSFIEAARAPRALDPPTSSSLAEEKAPPLTPPQHGGRAITDARSLRASDVGMVELPSGVELPDDRTGFSRDQACT
jgi:hypothetical protein